MIKVEIDGKKTEIYTFEEALKIDKETIKEEDPYIVGYFIKDEKSTCVWYDEIDEFLDKKDEIRIEALIEKSFVEIPEVKISLSGKYEFYSKKHNSLKVFDTLRTKKVKGRDVYFAGDYEVKLYCYKGEENIIINVDRKIHYLKNEKDSNPSIHLIKLFLRRRR